MKYYVVYVVLSESSILIRYVCTSKERADEKAEDLLRELKLKYNESFTKAVSSFVKEVDGWEDG